MKKVVLILCCFVMMFNLTSCDKNNFFVLENANDSVNILQYSADQEYPIFNHPITFDGFDSIDNILEAGLPEDPIQEFSENSIDNNKNIGNNLGNNNGSNSGGSGNTNSGSGSNNSQNSYNPNFNNETKAIWISYLDLDYLLRGKSQQQFTNNITTAFKSVSDIGLNTVIVHVRPFSDSIYKSDLFPWSKYASGTFGKATNFDPLKIIVDVAKKYNLEVHAWINPMRAVTDSEINSISNTYKLKQWYDDNNKRGDYIFKHSDNRWYYNPGVPDVVNLISDGAAEIVRKYNVDAIHIDDYFYPSGISESYDRASYTRYKSSGGNLSLSDWRINNNDNLVKSMYNAIKSANKNVKFGVSPSGNNSYNVSTMYADPRKWVSSSGYLDYIAPQIYYGFLNSAKPFESTVREWNNYIKAPNIEYVVGLATYKVGTIDNNAGSGKNEWVDNANSGNGDMMKRQIIYSRTASKYKGFALYDYKSLFDQSGYIKANMSKEAANIKSVIK